MNSKDNHWSEHGLGHLLNPSDLEDEDRDWIAQVWTAIIRNSLGIPAEKITFENIPAIGRLTITSPGILEALRDLNKTKKYSDQIKAFNFLLTCHINPLGHPIGANPEKFHLIANFELNPDKWEKMNWIDQYSGQVFKINSSGNYGSRQIARVKSYGEVFEEYEYHPESKCADAKGIASKKQTIGLLQRRHIRIDHIKCIGKESNSLEEVEAGSIHSAENVYTVYPDLGRDDWERKIRPALKQVPPFSVDQGNWIIPENAHRRSNGKKAASSEKPSDHCCCSVQTWGFVNIE